MEQKGKAGRKAQVYDPVRKKYVALTPEERVRQFVIRFLTAVVKETFPEFYRAPVP